MDSSDPSLQPSIPTPASEPQIVVPVEAPVTSSSAVIGSVTVPPKKESLKPWEMATLILVAVALIWCGMGMKHAKKPVAKPAHKVVAVVKKATKPATKAVIKVKSTKKEAVKAISQKPARHLSHKRVEHRGTVDEVLGRE
jgi:hypothetical protein